MSSLPKWLLAGGFLAGFLVMCGALRVISPSEPVRWEDLLAGFAMYAAIIGGTLLVPWVLLPVIANQPHRTTRLIIAVLAGLLPAVVAIGVVTCLFSGWDVPTHLQVAFCLSIAAWFVPALGSLAYMVTNGASQPATQAKRTNLAVVAIFCVSAPLVVANFSFPIIAVAGWVTRTESPKPEQVAHAREFLFINPELEIEPLAYYLKDGMDYMVRFKFLAKTDDPAQIFDRISVDPSTFGPNFNFPLGEVMHDEAWWDISSRPMSGGHIRVPYDRTLTIGYVENDDDTITVYAWRHEGQFDLTKSKSPQTDA